ncbi:probable palmitoyltransferase ZDHHC24 [Calliphora vicina]|uniref:probable palmitoyltransferase ZDHHC24 n=1 Tax=Calliphora vicina TaxID=7373 RepID=UPI00325B8618
MTIRYNILPRRLVDWLCFLLINVSTFIIFIFELVVVIPALHEPGGFWYLFTFILATFLIFQIKGNYMGCLITATNVDYNTLRQPSGDIEKLESLGWHECKKCDKLAPPRSWHCSVCKSCILKRDHHCFFTACCIGHNNERYFIMYLVNLFIGSAYALIYNSIYIWILNGHIYFNLMSILRAFFPFVMLYSGGFIENMFLIFYGLNILALLYSTILLAYHLPTVLKGGVSHERDNDEYLYNKGSWKRNLETVLGKRMHLVWLSPMIKSDLPDDGINWKMTEENMTKKNTNKKTK